MPSENQEPRRDPELKRKAWLAVFVGSALFWVVVVLVIWHWWGQVSITSERERVIAPPIQSGDDDNTPDTTVFRSVPQHWTLTPQQRAFIDAFADEVSQK